MSSILGAVNSYFLQPQVNALGAAGAAIGRAGNFLGNLSHRDNVEMQAEYLAKSLRAKGLSDADAWAAAHQYASEKDIHTVSQSPAALQQLAAMLAQAKFNHR